MSRDKRKQRQRRYHKREAERWHALPYAERERLKEIARPLANALRDTPQSMNRWYDTISSVGVTFSPEVRKLITESGDVASAQQIILKDIQRHQFERAMHKRILAEVARRNWRKCMRRKRK